MLRRRMPRKPKAAGAPRTFVKTVVEVEGRREDRVVEVPAFEPAPWAADAPLGIVGARGKVTLLQRTQHLGRNDQPPRLREIPHRARDPGGIAVRCLEQRAFEIARDLNVHRGAERAMRGARGINARRQRAFQNVVGIGCDDETIHRKAHARRRFAGENIAEIPRRHHEARLAFRARAERGRRREVIDALRHDAREVDRIDRRQIRARREGGVGKERLHDVLGIVEGAFQRDVVNVGIEHARHLTALNVGSAPLRVHHHDIDVGQSAQGGDGGRPVCLAWFCPSSEIGRAHV